MNNYTCVTKKTFFSDLKKSNKKENEQKLIRQKETLRELKVTILTENNH